MNPLVGGIQQVGIGVEDAEVAFQLYKKAFGFRVRVFDDKAAACHMTRYTGGSVHKRRAILSVNPNGGGGFEIWQYTDRTPLKPREPVGLGDRGIVAVIIRCYDLETGTAQLLATGFKQEGATWFRCPLGHLFHLSLVGGRPYRAMPFGGVDGVVLGVADLPQARTFYHSVLGIPFDPIVIELPHAPLEGLSGYFRNPEKAPFSHWYGDFRIKLVQAGPQAENVYHNRYWGDCGFIHLCLDVVKFQMFKGDLNGNNVQMTVDSGASFKMGASAGRFGYSEDPDGSLIEWVEVHELPIIPRLGVKIRFGKATPRAISRHWIRQVIRFL